MLQCLWLRLAETLAHEGTDLPFPTGPLEVGDCHQIEMPMSKMSYFMDSDLGEHGLLYFSNHSQVDSYI